MAIKFRPFPDSPRLFDPLAASTLILALMVAAYQLVVTKWIDSLYIMLTITLFGGVLGLSLGYSRFSPILAIIFSLLYGMIVVPWQVALTLGRGVPWASRLVEIGGGLKIALIQLWQGEPVRSPLFFLTLMAVLFWGCSVLAGFTLVRLRRPWSTVLPVGLVTLIIYLYGSATSLSAGYLATYIFLVLLLVSRMFIKEKQTQWRQTHTQVPDLINFDVMRVTLLITIVLVFAAWLIPTGVAALPSLQDAWLKVTRSWEALNVRLEGAFAAIKPSAKLVSGYYGETLPLGRGNSRSEDLFLVVDAPARPSSAVRYYWRARSFDQYLDGGWHNSGVETTFTTPDQPDLHLPETIGRWNANFRITTQALISTLYLPVETKWVSRPIEVVSASNKDGSLDIAAVHANPQLRAGSIYETRSALSNFTIEELRGAGTDYPNWVIDRYLQLPPTITPRTLELAEWITQGQDNPHDKAVAITLWLRENIEYSYTMPRLPEDQDLVDWLLFDLRRGFCNYYATAEVILLRASGIPARFSAGYAQGERLTEPDGTLDMPEDGRVIYQVLEKNAHSWPEVYFPNFGWVEFEPTTSQEPLVRPLNREPVRSSPLNDREMASLDENEFEDEFSKRAFLLEREYERLRTQSTTPAQDSPIDFGYLLQIILLIAGGLGIYLLWRARRRREIPPIPVVIESGIQRLGWSPPGFIRRWALEASLPPLDRAYHEVNLALKRIGSPALPTDTPLERVAKLTHLLPATAVAVQMLLREYQASVYSPEPGDWVSVMPNMRLIRKQSYLGLLRRIIPFPTRK